MSAVPWLATLLIAFLLNLVSGQLQSWELCITAAILDEANEFGTHEMYFGVGTWYNNQCNVHSGLDYQPMTTDPYGTAGVCVCSRIYEAESPCFYVKEADPFGHDDCGVTVIDDVFYDSLKANAYKGKWVDVSLAQDSNCNNLSPGLVKGKLRIWVMAGLWICNNRPTPEPTPAPVRATKPTNRPIGSAPRPADDFRAEDNDRIEDNHAHSTIESGSNSAAQNRRDLLIVFSVVGIFIIFIILAIFTCICRGRQRKYMTAVKSKDDCSDNEEVEAVEMSVKETSDKIETESACE